MGAIGSFAAKILTAGSMAMGSASGDFPDAEHIVPAQLSGETAISTPVDMDLYRTVEFLLCDYLPAISGPNDARSISITARSSKALLEGEFGGEINVADRALVTRELLEWMDFELRPVHDTDGNIRPSAVSTITPELAEEFMQHYTTLGGHIQPLVEEFLDSYPQYSNDLLERRANLVGLGETIPGFNSRLVFGPHSSFASNQEFLNDLTDGDGSIPGLPKPPEMSDRDFWRPYDSCTFIMS